MGNNNCTVGSAYQPRVLLGPRVSITFKVPPYCGVRVVAAAEVALAALGANVAEVVGFADWDVLVVAGVLLQPTIRKESTRMTTNGIKYLFTIASSEYNIFGEISV